MSILDESPFPFHKPDGQELWRVIAGMFPVPFDAITFAERFEVDPLDVQPNPTRRSYRTPHRRRSCVDVRDAPVIAHDRDALRLAFPARGIRTGRSGAATGAQDSGNRTESCLSMKHAVEGDRTASLRPPDCQPQRPYVGAAAKLAIRSISPRRAAVDTICSRWMSCQEGIDVENDGLVENLVCRRGRDGRCCDGSGSRSL